MKNSCLVLFAFYLLLSCSTIKQESDISIIEVKMLEDIDVLSPDSLFISVDYLPLETTSNSLIDHIDKLIIKDSLYYILDRKQKTIFTFDKDGKYVSKLNKIGRGPGEYISIEDFCIQDSMLYLFSSDIRRILVYDLFFNHLFSFNTETFGTNIAVNGDDLYLFSNFNSEIDKQFFKYNRFTGKYIDSYLSYNPKQRGVSSNSSTFAKHRDSLYCFIPYDFSIYKLDNNIEKIYAIDFGKDMPPKGYKDWTYEERMDYHRNFSDPWKEPIHKIYDLYIGDNLLYFSFLKTVLRCHFFEWKNLNKRFIGYIGFTEDFPLDKNTCLYVDDNIYISYNQVERILDFKDKQDKVNLDSRLFTLDIQDNPVLCIYKFKELE